MRNEERIRRFFGFYRQRAANISVLSDMKAPEVTPYGMATFYHDQHVLLAAGIDSLAKFWAALYAPRISSHGKRMGEFLVQNADANIFGRCSVPDLLRRAHRERVPWANALSKLVSAMVIDTQVRHWNADPVCDVLRYDFDLTAAGADPEWLRRSRYGEVLYRYYRNGWVHELDRSPVLGSHDFGVLDEPHYENRSGMTEKRLVFTTRFLLQTYGRTIDNFEARCLADGKEPNP